MPLSTGSNLIALFKFKKAGVLTDPSPLPTLVTGSLYPNGTAGPTPALTHVAAGEFSATVFTTLQSTQVGTYEAWVYSTDTTLDSVESAVEWPEVGINPSDPMGAVVPGSYALGTAGYALGLIGSQGMAITVVGPMVTGRPWLVYRTFDYYATESQQMYWDLVGWPSLVGATARFIGAGSSLALTIDTTLNRLTLELTKTQSAALFLGMDTYGIYVTFVNSHEVLVGTGRIEVRPRPD